MEGSLEADQLFFVVGFSKPLGSELHAGRGLDWKALVSAAPADSSVQPSSVTALSGAQRELM